MLVSLLYTKHITPTARIPLFMNTKNRLKQNHEYTKYAQRVAPSPIV